VASNLLSRFKKEQPISVQPRELMGIALENLHPLADSSWWKEGFTDLLPANLYWRVANEGVLGRCFHLHPIFVYPQRKNAVFFGTVDDDFCEAACPNSDNDYVVTDSDEFLAVELSDLSHFFRTSFRKGSVEDAANWAEQFASNRHRKLFDRVSRMHTGFRDHQAWKQAEKEAEVVASEIKERLNLPIFKLSAQSSIRRLIRISLDQRLRLANRRAPSGAIARLAYYGLNTLSSGVVDSYHFAIRYIISQRHWLFGSLDKPRWFTVNRMIRDYLQNELLQLVSSAAQVLLISENSKQSVIRSILNEADLKVVEGDCLPSKEKNYFIYISNDDHAAPQSFQWIVIEPGLRIGLREVAKATYSLLGNSGRVVILSGHVGSGALFNETDALERAQAEKLLRPGYTVLDHRKIGGPGSFDYYKFSHKLKDRVRRNPMLFRIVEFALPFLWIPLMLVIFATGGCLARVIDRFDRRKRSWLCSLTIAVKASEPQRGELTTEKEPAYSE